MLRMSSSVCVWRVLGPFDLKAYLWVLHYALDAVEVGEVADRLVGIIQHSSDGLKDKWAAWILDSISPVIHFHKILPG